MSSCTTKLALVAASVSLLLAACGGSEQEATTVGNSDAGEQTTTTATEAATTTTAAPETAEAPTTSAQPVTPPSDYAGFAAQKTACGADAPEPAAEMSFAAPEDQSLDPDTTVHVTIVTSCGDLEVDLYPDIAPETVNSFVFLARSGYFDGTVSHRVAPGFVVQAGDPSATSRGGPGYFIPDELPETGFLYESGMLAMANAGPGTTGSQFFIVFADVPLPPNYSYFGKVVDGFDTLEAISHIPLGTNAYGEQSVPLETLYLEQVIVE